MTEMTTIPKLELQNLMLQNSILQERLYWCYTSTMTLLGGKILSFDAFCANIDKAMAKINNEIKL